MIRVTAFEYTDRFKRELRSAGADIQREAAAALNALKVNPRSVRAHPLHGFRPKLYSMDVTSNHSWQITFELQGETAKLIRIARHKEINRAPR